MCVTRSLCDNAAVVCCSAFNQHKTRQDKMMDYKPRQRNSCGVCLRYCLAVANILFLVSYAPSQLEI